MLSMSNDDMLWNSRLLVFFFRSNATKLLKEAEDVSSSLNKTQDAQTEAESAIEQAWEDYRTVENILNQVHNRNIGFSSHHVIHCSIK